MEISKEDEATLIEMPDLIGLSLKEAKEKLKEMGIEYLLEGEEGVEKNVAEQIPSKGIKINEGTRVILSLE